jgi:O6-methylguanine-DNA--protein-cysteine methyltransferase
MQCAQAVYYMVSQVPPGSVTSIKCLTDLLDSGYMAVGRALRKSPITPISPDLY